MSVERLTVHLSHGSDIVVWILEADEAIAFGLSCTFVPHHLMTTILVMISFVHHTQLLNQ